MSLSVTYTESPNTVIRSARWNRNFDDVEDWANAHEIDASGVHGVTGNIVGTTDTQTLSNKIFDLTDVKIYGGYDLKLYSDSGTTLKASIDGATGNTSLEGTLGVTGASTFGAGVTLNSNDPTLILKGNLTSGVHYNYLKFQNNAGTDIFQMYGSYYGGASNTYLLPASGQGLSLGANGVTNYLTISTSGNTAIAGTLSIPTATKLFLDGGSNTSIRESAADTLTMELGGTDAITIKAEGILLPDTDPPTANYANRNGIVKGWCRANSSGTTLADYNTVTPITKTATGRYIVFWDTDFSSNDYACVATAVDGSPNAYIATIMSTATSQAIVQITDDANVDTDKEFSIISIGDQ